MKRYRMPSPEVISTVATPLSRMSFKKTRVISTLMPKEKELAVHVGEGVFLTRCSVCGETFISPGASRRPPNLVRHLFNEHDIYDGYEKPSYIVDGRLI